MREHDLRLIAWGMCSYLGRFPKPLKRLLVLALQLFLFWLSRFLSISCWSTYLLRPRALQWLDPSYAEIDLSFLSFIMFIAVIASMVQLVEMIVEKFAPALYGALGTFPSLDRGELCYSWEGLWFMQQKDFSGVY